MIVLCEFEKVGLFLRCIHCGKQFKFVAGSVFSRCRIQHNPDAVRPKIEKSGLGTRLRKNLESVGITKERVSRFIGKPCGCEKREEVLNNLGNQISDFFGARDVSMCKWAYGITTVPERLETVFPQTLESLRLAGFDQPRLFVDGENDCGKYVKFGLETTLRYPRVKTAANWVLSIVELYLREPSADRYAIFQDDFVTYRNLRQYLDTRGYPDEKGYCNLYTFPQNQQLATAGHKGWFESNQKGKGAVALVFSNEALIALLHQTHLIERPKSVRGDRAIDGGIVSAMKKAGYREYVHSPSLVQHTGLVSSMGNPKHPLAPAFEGEGFDAMKLL